MLVEGFEGAQFVVDAGGLLRALDAHVNVNGCFGGNHIGAGSALNYDWIHGDSLPRIIQLRDYWYLTCEFKKAAVAFAGVESGVRSHAFYAQRISANAFARGLDCAAKTGGGFENDRSGKRFR